MIAVRCDPGEVMPRPLYGGSHDGTTNTSYTPSAIGIDIPRYPGDTSLVLAVTTLNDNVSMSSWSLTAGGAITLSNQTKRSDGGTATGFDVRNIIHTATLSTMDGPGSIQLSGTLSGSSQGGTAIIYMSAVSHARPSNQIVDIVHQAPAYGSGGTAYNPEGIYPGQLAVVVSLIGSGALGGTATADSATYGGVEMTKVGSVPAVAGLLSGAGLGMFILHNPPPGEQIVEVWGTGSTSGHTSGVYYAMTLSNVSAIEPILSENAVIEIPSIDRGLILMASGGGGDWGTRAEHASVINVISPFLAAISTGTVYKQWGSKGVPKLTESGHAVGIGLHPMSNEGQFFTMF